MPEVVSCPKCRRKSRVPDTLVGKQVKCPDCGEVFTADVSPPAAPPEKKQPAADDLDVVEEREDEPRKRSGRQEAPSRSRRKRDDDEDDDRPRRRKGRSRGDREDDDDDEDDRPRRRARGTEGGTDTFGLLSVIIGSVALALIPLGCCCAGITWYAAVPVALIGGILGLWGRGALRVVGLVLNILAFLPAVLMMVLLIVGVALPAAMGGGRGPMNNPAPGAPGRFAPRP